MPTLFTRIINGEIPGRFVWQDERAVAFLSINPLRPGHTLVVPRQEVDHWLDLPADLAAHLVGVAQSIGKALMRAYRPTKVGMCVVGLEVPHVHLHVSPIDRMADLDFRNAAKSPTAAELDAAAAAVRAALRELGYAQVAG